MKYVHRPGANRTHDVQAMQTGTVFRHHEPKRNDFLDFICKSTSAVSTPSQLVGSNTKLTYSTINMTLPLS